ncbi:hypothetical protein V6R21_11265 [Limibacter armeniacum]|uniref:hypothetical protein n=1 Tax=Limibacter armeniacum TaxID=466084 RepID=UPI002FE59983
MKYYKISKKIRWVVMHTEQVDNDYKLKENLDIHGNQSRWEEAPVIPLTLIYDSSQEAPSEPEFQDIYNWQHNLLWNMWPEPSGNYLVISKRFWQVLKTHTLPENFIYDSLVAYKGEKKPYKVFFPKMIEPYWFWENFNYRNSLFKESKSFRPNIVYQSKLSFQDKEEILKVNTSKFLDEDRMIYPEKVMLNEPWDIFVFGINFFISERLKDALEQAGCNVGLAKYEIDFEVIS